MHMPWGVTSFEALSAHCQGTPPNILLLLLLLSSNDKPKASNKRGRALSTSAALLESSRLVHN